MGVQLYELRPHAPTWARHRIEASSAEHVSLHAKVVIFDRRWVYIGSFNLDPRSANLNTEVGVFIDNPGLARQVDAGIHRDMQPGNSWNARSEDPDEYAPLGKRIRLSVIKLLPLEPLL